MASRTYTRKSGIRMVGGFLADLANAYTGSPNRMVTKLAGGAKKQWDAMVRKYNGETRKRRASTRRVNRRA